ncbi:hypothetical protein GXP70_12045 [Paenibacillus lycopersici]|uniref:Serine acetyltransferase n=1 Tax=Paenibacillus lycopersici TaxID=2704462 RepID=A0A6C0G803_9BACL|nr:hypothetical protein GXP70_12045 [Paenibacillus lycopersici]
MNKVINNCVIYSSCYIGSGTKIAYGGVGVLIHPKTVIGKNCMIGTDVTIGAAPVIGNHVYVSTGSRLVGVGIKVGSFSIVGANAVVTGDVPPFSIVAGVPAKVVGAITPGNLDKYLESYLAVVNKKNTTFVDKVKAEFLESYKKYTEGHPRSSIEVNKPIGLPKSDIDILHKKLNALYQMLEEKETKVKEINDQLSKLKSSKLYRILKFIGLLKQ